MNRTVFRDAITLFEYSTTAKGGRGPVGKWAGLVIKRLWELYKASEIGFVRQDSDHTRGSWDPSQPFINLQVNPHYINSLPENQRLAAISLVLVHEGVHAALDFLDDKSIYSELAARKLTVYYYRELSGPGVFNEASDPPAPGKRAQLILLPRNAFPEYVKMSRFLDRDQLIDYILAIPSYTDPDDLTPQWIVETLSLWGGLRNRWPATRGLYVKTLAKSRQPHYESFILTVLESIDNQRDWDAMIEEAGRLRTIRIALGDLTSRRDLERIASLEKKWRINLTENPPYRCKAYSASLCSPTPD
jgi:hypothetical protein